MNPSKTNQQASASAKLKTMEFSVRAPKNSGMSLQMMHFAKHLNFSFEDVKKAQIKFADVARETLKEAQPEFGAGSQYGQQQKFTPKPKKGKANSQSYILKTKSRSGALKKYKSMREGGLMENSDYYVLVNGARGFEAYPLEEWHTFRTAPMENAISSEKIEGLFKKQSQGQFDRFKSSKDEEGGNIKSNDSSDNFSSDDESDKKEVRRKLKSNRRIDNSGNDESAESSDDENKEVDYAAESEVDSDEEEENEQELYLDTVAEEEDITNALTAEEESDHEFIDCAEELDPDNTLQTGSKRKAEVDSFSQQHPQKKRKQ